MIVRIFRNNNPAFFLVIFIIIIAMWIPSLFGEQIVYHNNNYLLFENLNFLILQNQRIVVIINYSILFIIGIILTNINTKFIIIEHRNFLTALFFLLLVSSFQETHQNISISISALLFITSIYLLLNSYKKKKAIEDIFIAAILIGLATLIVPAYVYMVFMLFFGLALTRPVYVREWLSVIWGFVLPFAFYFSFAFLNDYNLATIQSYFLSNIYSPFNITADFTLINSLFLGVYFLFMAISSYYILFRSPILKVRNKKYFKYFFYIFVLLFVSSILNSKFFYLYFSLAAFPLAFLLSYMFNESKRKVITDILFIVLVLSCFLNVYGEKIIPN